MILECCQASPDLRMLLTRFKRESQFLRQRIWLRGWGGGSKLSGPLLVDISQVYHLLSYMDSWQRRLRRFNDLPSSHSLWQRSDVLCSCRFVSWTPHTTQAAKGETGFQKGSRERTCHPMNKTGACLSSGWL